MQSQIIFSNAIAHQLNCLINQLAPSKVFILADSTTEFICKKYLPDIVNCQSAILITIPQGENHKNIESLQYIWSALIDNNADRRALLINFGGGMVTDIGGFAASTFKRGIKYINMPTTLLAAVDASIGGKTAINHNNIKNAIGAFYQPFATIVSTITFDSLMPNDILSGYGEMLKHALLKGDDSIIKLLNFNLHQPDSDTLLSLLEESLKVKADIVAQDPYEQGIRKALNFGHTIGHAFESFSLEKEKPISHGIAVAYGIVAELILSHIHLQFPSNRLYQISNFVKENFGPYHVTCKKYPNLIGYMKHDKKNFSSDFNFTLLSDVGMPIIDCQINEEEVKNALDIFGDLMQ